MEKEICDPVMPVEAIVTNFSPTDTNPGLWHAASFSRSHWRVDVGWRFNTADWLTEGTQAILVGLVL